MLEYKPDYEALVGKEKLERREEIKNSGVLNEKRVHLSRNEAIKERLKKLHDAISEYTKQYPEVISFAVFGSLMKGYSVPESDIDGYLLFASKKSSKLDLETHLFHAENFKIFLREKLNLSKEQVSHVFTEIISCDLLKEDIRDGNVTHLDSLFMINIPSVEIKKYRKVIIEELEKMGKKGEILWKDIMWCLFRKERKGLENYDQQQKMFEKLYPLTIEKGRKQFL